ncbi:MAG: ATP-binding cassette domain-containing protein [Sutterellaceae bacterium]|nr:ATP-binding cassette domain-containing protein [Sutterellaceae bacterium]
MSAGLDLCVEKLVHAVSDGSERKTLLNIEELKIPSGTHCVLKGASGSGKTTFLRLISGIAAPSSGVIRWGQTDVTRLGAGERDRWRGKNVGFLFQDFRLFEGLTALENVLLPCGFYARVTQKDRKRAQELLETVGVCPTTRTANLSRGEMQRTALARLLMTKPKVILADEPTASLDTENARHVLDLLMQSAHDSGATLIVASHDPTTMSRIERCLTVKNETVFFEN